MQLPVWKFVGEHLRWFIGVTVIGPLLAYLPLTSPSNTRLASRVLIFALWAVSYNLMLSYVRLPTLSHGLFLGLGQYAIALPWLHFGWSPELLFIAAPLVAAAMALVLGAVAVRATALHFALLTLAGSQLVYVAALQLYSVTRGENGIYGIPMPAWLMSTEAVYRFVVITVLVCLAGLWIIGRSPFGAILRAIGENPARAEAVGINVRRFQLAAFVVSSMFAGISGVLLLTLNRSVSPQTMHWFSSAQPLFMTIIGGMQSFFGPILGAAFVTITETELTRVTSRTNIFFGSAVLVIALFAQGGLIGAIGRFRSWLDRKSQEHWRRRRERNLPQHIASKPIVSDQEAADASKGQ